MTDALYIPRRLAIGTTARADKNAETTVLQSDLFDQDWQVLILLAEPGAGKTRFTREIARQPGGCFVAALEGNTAVREAASEANKILIVDGLDEIAEQQEIESLLQQLPKDGRRLILTCRAAEWEAARCAQVLELRFGQEALKFTRFDRFSEEEIEQLVRAYAPERDAEVFIRDARERGLEDWLQNPQNLQLLLDASTGGDWPRTRTALFDQAVQHAVQEANRAHQITERSNEENIRNAAGELMAAMLLSGSEGVATVNGNERFPALSDIASDVTLAQSALNTRLFLDAGPGRFVPAHRTIAEMLATRWLSQRLRTRQISFERLRALIIQNGVIRTDLLGFYGWLASLAPQSERDRLIEYQPAAVFLYGDPVRFASPAEKERLIEALKKQSQENPALYESAGVYVAPAHPEFYTSELKELVRDILKSEDIAPSLKRLLIETVRGSPLAETLGALLVSIVEDPRQRWDVRDSAAEVVPRNLPDQLSAALIAVAREGTSHAEQLIARVIEARPGELDPQKVAEALVAFAEAAGETDHPYRSGLALERGGLPARSLSIILDNLARSLGRRRAHGAQRQVDKVNRILSGFQLILLHTYIKEGLPFEVEQLWKWLRYLDSPTIHKREILSELKPEFAKRPEIRRDLQTRALSDREFSDSVWMAVVHWIPHVLPFLQLSPEDACYQLDRIAAASDGPDAEEWLELVRFFGSDENVAAAVKEHRAEYPALDETYQTVAWDQPHPAVEEHRRDWAKREEARRKQHEEERKQWIAQFRGIKADVAAGAHLGWLSDIAMERLGRFSDIEGETADERTVDLVGEENLDIAKAGLRAYLKKAELPTVAEIADLRRDEKRHRGEWIIAAAILLHVEEGGRLEDIPDRACEIAALQYVEFPGVREWTDIATELRRRIFADPAWAERFLRAWFEPALEAGEGLLSEQSWLEDEALDRNLATLLAVDWLGRFSQTLSENAGPTLFRLAAEHEDEDAVQDLIDTRMADLDAQPEPLRPWWAALAFLRDFDRHHAVIRKRLRLKNHKNWLWTFLNFLRSDMRSRLQGHAGETLAAGQLAFLIQHLGRHWPPESPPEGAYYGDIHPWEAANFIGGLIAELATLEDDEGANHFQYLIGLKKLAPWHAMLRSQRDRWMSRKWGKFRPGIEAVRAVMSGGPPRSPEDLKVTVLETLEELQQEVRRGNTKEWQKFWHRSDADDRSPQDENYCRDRILESIREKLRPVGIDLRPEARMREETRADIVATAWIDGEIVDLPIEVKGQWHKELWTAAKEQLQPRYAEYRNARGHGVYLVLWFGETVPNKNCKHHPRKRRAPSGPEKLKVWLEDDMPSEIRAAIEVFVLDVTQPYLD